jgi:pimeloyl-ACP methyl ester carboxylesterase
MSQIDVAGRRIELLEIPGEDPPLVLLHEGLGSVGLWRDFPQRLAAATRGRVVAFSRFGHGDSDPPPQRRTPSFMHEEALEVLPQVLSAVGARDPILVGHSDGASIALIYASEHHPKAVVAIAPHVFVEEICLTEIRAAKSAYETTGLRQRMAQHHRDPDQAFYGWNDVWLHPEFPKWDLRSELSAITCPLLLIQGERDQYGTLAQLDEIEHRVSAPVDRVHLDCQHSPPTERPTETVAAIAEWLTALRSAGSEQPPAARRSP